MRTYLVVAHRTLVDQHLLDELQALARTEPSRFHLIVPMRAPAGQAWTEGSVRAATQARLEEALATIRGLGLEADGEVGDGHPVEAVKQCLRRRDLDVDEVILSTLPPGPSRWLRWDVPHRLAEAVSPIPVHHVMVTRTPTRA